MPDSVSSATPVLSSRAWRMRPATLAGAAVAGALMAAAVLLWDHYGSAVFFEMIAAGFASCL
jgi:hypothetical protein